MWECLQTQHQRFQDLLGSSCQKNGLLRVERAAASTRSCTHPVLSSEQKANTLTERTGSLGYSLRRCGIAGVPWRPRRRAAERRGRSCQGVTHFGIRQVLACEAPQTKSGLGGVVEEHSQTVKERPLQCVWRVERVGFVDFLCDMGGG